MSRPRSLTPVPRPLVSLALALLLLLTLSGCNQADRLYAYLQYAGPKLSFSPGKMTMTIGDGKYNLRKVMTKQKYVGEVKKGRVTVAYLDGTREQAEQLADDFDRMYELVKERLGLDWAFDLTVKFVDAADTPREGWFYSERLRSNRRVTFPLIVSGRPSTTVAATVAHEMTEASMVYPEHRRQMVLSDAWLGPFVLSYHTRWFRDGLSDYAANLFACDVMGEEPVMHPDFVRLAEVRDDILKWHNPGEDEDYGAALALIYELADRNGEETLPSIFADISSKKGTGGRSLRQIVEKETGLDLRRFLEAYETPWLGFSVAQTGSDRLLVGQVWEGTPASRWRLRRGDRILKIGGEEVTTTGRFHLLLAKAKVGSNVEVVTERDGQQRVLHMKTIAHPTDMAQFERLNRYRPRSAATH